MPGENWTKGPWEVWVDTHGVFAHVRPGRNKRGSISGVRIAECEDEDLYSGLNTQSECIAEARANAHLIAAAPELYMAVQSLLRLAFAMGVHPSWADCVQAQAVLTKARGEVTRG